MARSKRVLFIVGNNVAHNVEFWEAVELLRRHLYVVALVSSPAEAMWHLGVRSIDVVISQRLLRAGVSGEQVLAVVSEEFPSVRRVLYDDTEKAGECTSHFVLPRPASKKQLLEAVGA